jgi:hypothetical protein
VKYDHDTFACFHEYFILNNLPWKLVVGMWFTFFSNGRLVQVNVVFPCNGINKNVSLFQIPS